MWRNLFPWIQDFLEACSRRSVLERKEELISIRCTRLGGTLGARLKSLFGVTVVDGRLMHGEA